jgi:phytoene dehydrogenase-like protein
LRWSRFRPSWDPRDGSDDGARPIISGTRRGRRMTSPGDKHATATTGGGCRTVEHHQKPHAQLALRSFPAVAQPGAAARKLDATEALRLARLLMLLASAMATELFDGKAARLLLLGNAMHADVPIDAPGSGVMGFLMLMLPQDAGFPVHSGGAGQLSAALVKRAASAGAQVQCGATVEAMMSAVDAP